MWFSRKEFYLWSKNISVLLVCWVHQCHSVPWLVHLQPSANLVHTSFCLPVPFNSNNKCMSTIVKTLLTWLVLTETKMLTNTLNKQACHTTKKKCISAPRPTEYNPISSYFPHELDKLVIAIVKCQPFYLYVHAVQFV